MSRIHSTNSWISHRGKWSFVVVYSVHLWEEGKSGSAIPAIMVHAQNNTNKTKLPLSLCMFFGSAFSLMLGLAMWLVLDNDTIRSVVQAKLSSCTLQLSPLWQHQGFLETYIYSYVCWKWKMLSVFLQVQCLIHLNDLELKNANYRFRSHNDLVRITRMKGKKCDS